MAAPEPTPPPEPMLSAHGVAKSFGRTKALVDVSLDLRAGEVHGLLGANGAGKSTLSRILSGHIAASGGTITHRGAPFAVSSTREALRAGIALVAQETSLAPDLTVLENIFLPEMGRPGRLSFRSMRARADAILSRLGSARALRLDAEVRSLSAAQRQLVEIAKALALDATLVIFDEPTASLSPLEVNLLFDIMGRLRDDGRALAFVSHRLEEVLAITDRVTILRDGRSVAEGIATATLTQADIIRHMVGREIGALYQERLAGDAKPAGEVVLEVAHLRAEPAVRDLSFAVRAGEIMGLGGLVGAGRSEAAEAIFGLRPRTGGTIRIDGHLVEPRSPRDAIALGIGMVAEDRRRQNIVPDLTVRENLLLARMGRHAGMGRGFGTASDQTRALLDRLGLPADRLDSSLLNFSGGMQQKVIIARWILIEPRILILDEPTKGVDVGTRSAIYRLLREIAEGGVAVVVISSDFEELLGLCDRVVVVSDGLTVADLSAARLTEEKLTLLAAPRSSTERNATLLRELSDASQGEAFWTLIDGEELICLACASHADAPGTGLRAGEVVSAADTTIPRAFALRSDSFVDEEDGARSTLLTQLRDGRGHDLGWVGLTVAIGHPRPSVADIAARVGRLAHAEQGGVQ